MVFSISYLAEAALLLISIPVLFYGLLCMKERSQEQLMSMTFFMAIGWIVIVLFKVPVLLIAAVNFLAGVLCLRKYMHTVEYSAEGT